MRVSRPLCADGKSAIFCVGYLPAKLIAEAGYQPEELDENLIHMVASSMFNGMFETVRYDMPREKAISYMNSLREFYSAGWFRLLGISGS